MDRAVGPRVAEASAPVLDVPAELAADSERLVQVLLVPARPSEAPNVVAVVRAAVNASRLDVAVVAPRSSSRR